MTAAIPDTYVPDFDIAVNGRPAPPELRAGVTSVRFEEALEGADRVELVLADPHLRLLDDPVLDLDNRLELFLGYRPADLSSVFLGEVTGIEPSFPAGGMPTLTVTAHDYLHRLSSGTRQRGFPRRLPDAAIAAIVAAENGLLARPDAATLVLAGLGLCEERPRFQNKQSDYDLLRQIVTEYGMDMWVDGSFLNLRLLLPRLPTSDLQLHWGRSLIDFTPRLSSVGQILTVALRVWIESLKTQFTVLAGWTGDRLQVGVRPVVFGAQPPDTTATLALPDVPLDNPVDAIKWALGELRRRVNTRVTGRGSAVGDPRLRAGRAIALSGLGTRFSAENYRITSVAHSLDGGGYRTSFEVRQEVV